MNNNIKVSLKKADGIKCNTYVKSIEQKMKLTYKDSLTIQGYIQQRQDAGYRKPIKEQKTKLINDLQTLRLNVLKSMQVFEKSLLQKSKELFLLQTQPYKKKLLEQLTTLQKQATWSMLTILNKQIQMMDDTLKTIQNIENATNFTTLNNEFRKYIYFKTQIEWK